MQELPASAFVPTEARFPADVHCTRIRFDGQQLPLASFLRHCARMLDPVGSPEHETRAADEPPALARARRVFLHAGLAALADDARPSWFQLGVAPPAGRELRVELYRQVALLARELLHDGAAGNFFLMHKPPGLRLRFESGTGTGSGSGSGVGRGGRVAPVAGRVRAAVAGWRRDGLVLAVEPGVYEPENRLFGGPVSMRYAHRVFTADSLAWLDFHAADPADTGPDWAVSLAMVRALLDALAIAGWEDIDVWDRIRDRTGRQLPSGAAELSELTEIDTELVELWQHPESLIRQLPPVARRIVDEYRAAVEPIGRQWRTGYFATEAAGLGPRAVAAFVIVFHWNRAGMTMLRQALLAQALATREAGVR
ncbi:thiopeptide-type bacteriocin biosynthesis protein [Kitasatospora cheerisanensis]|uniref:Thiopeptide-type bacteriocin biosynthesis domain-containing protein n=1 Tax=Kitasatospora cheerisanensis KCTC 2395 TaxID=1348663 RepID=A0A066ZAR4_9ACTN|nr:thiopeptide-type bacteriocin biosynthesis protein [Kitasatospora cheerisanensis]KDN87205.1 hypothetical protein KCH_10260 [Kitasatospora cheerisanensis KCTC 2395]